MVLDSSRSRPGCPRRNAGTAGKGSGAVVLFGDPKVRVGTLASLIDGYIAGRSDVTECSLGKLKNAKGPLIEFFGDVKLDAITPGVRTNTAGGFCRNSFRPRPTRNARLPLSSSCMHSGMGMLIGTRSTV